MSVDKAQSAKLVKKPGMPEARPCLRKKHGGPHTPDLTGLKNVFGYLEVLRQGPNDKHECTNWVVRDKFGHERTVEANALFTGKGSGRAARGFGDRSEVNSPEYCTVRSHLRLKESRLSYRFLVFFDGWNPKKDGSILEGARWINTILGPKPGPNWQLHVLKTRMYPHGYFGPDDKDGRHIVWRHKMDRHDQDLLDLIHEWPKKKLREFVRNEVQPLLKAA